MLGGRTPSSNCNTSSTAYGSWQAASSALTTLCAVQFANWRLVSLSDCGGYASKLKTMTIQSVNRGIAVRIIGADDGGYGRVRLTIPDARVE